MASHHACATIMMANGHQSTSGTANDDPDGKPHPIVYL
jgi:hypothetical protein